MFCSALRRDYGAGYTRLYMQGSGAHRSLTQGAAGLLKCTTTLFAWIFSAVHLAGQRNFRASKGYVWSDPPTRTPSSNCRTDYILCRKFNACQALVVAFYSVTEQTHIYPYPAYIQSFYKSLPSKSLAGVFTHELQHLPSRKARVAKPVGDGPAICFWKLMHCRMGL